MGRRRGAVLLLAAALLVPCACAAPGPVQPQPAAAPSPAAEEEQALQDSAAPVEDAKCEARERLRAYYDQGGTRGATFFGHGPDAGAPATVLDDGRHYFEPLLAAFEGCAWSWAEAEGEPESGQTIEMYPFVFYSDSDLVRYGGEMAWSCPPEETPIPVQWYQAPGAYEAVERAFFPEEG